MDEVRKNYIEMLALISVSKMTVNDWIEYWLKQDILALNLKEKCN